MKPSYNFLIYGFGVLKLLIHFLTNTTFGLHRDEYLYYEEGQRLAWGFMEVPPFTPFIGKISDVLGGSIFTIRLFPAIAGAIIIIMVCKLARDLGGGKWAIVFSGLALLLSPALLGTNSLYQPVSFNQLFWFLCAWSLIKIIQQDLPTYWYFLGFMMGIGFLNKYSILFYLVAILIAFLITPNRKLLAKKEFFLSIIIAAIIALPNIIWQINHDFPVIGHMQTLSENQLVHVNWGEFLSTQFIFHAGLTIVWIVGIIAVFRIKDLKPYRFVAYAFFFTVLIIGLLRGKDYYTLGAFPILFPFGGVALEHWIKKTYIRTILVASMVLGNLPVLPFVLPIGSLEFVKNYISKANERGIYINQDWEDGKQQSLPQDFADMHGWEELAPKVAKVYNELSPADQKRCMIYGGSYGHAGAINFFRDENNLPEAYSFSSSYILWVEEDLNFDFNIQIMIDDRKHNSSDYFSTLILKDSIEHPDARDPGYIYLQKDPKVNVKEAWKRLVRKFQTWR